MGLISEFKAFALRGNVLDLAVGVIIGGAFGKIVTSLVSDIIMPMLNPIIPGGSWHDLVIGQGIKIGAFAGYILDFMIVASCVFLMMKGINRFIKKKEETPLPPVQSSEEKLLTEIRDLLKNRPLT